MSWHLNSEQFGDYDRPETNLDFEREEARSERDYHEAQDYRD